MNFIDNLTKILYEIKVNDHNVKDVVHSFFLTHNISLEDKEKYKKACNYYIDHHLFLHTVVENKFPIAEKDTLIYFFFIAFLICKHGLKFRLYEDDFNYILENSHFINNELFLETISLESIKDVCTDNFLSTYLNTFSKEEKKLFSLNITKEITNYLSKYYDKETIIKLFSKRPHKYNYFAINPLKASVEEYELDSNYELLSFENPLQPNLFLVKKTNKEIPSKNEDVINGKLFLLDLSYVKVFDNIYFHKNDEAVEFTAKTGNVSAYLSLILNIVDGKLLAVYENEAGYARGRNFYQRLGITDDNIDTLLCGKDYKNIKKYIQKGSKNIVVCNPQTSEISMLNRRRDLLVNFNIEKFIQLYADKALDYLRESSIFVKSKGRLIYISKSFLPFETTEVVNKFLNENEDFYLVEEKMILPIENDCDGIYYAILKKVQK